MFKLFGKKAESVSDEKEETASQSRSPTGSISLDTSTVPVDDSSFNINVETHGTKGYPKNISCLKYIRNLGLLCIGSKDGAVFALGDGVDYLLPSIDPDGDDIQVRDLLPCAAGSELLVVYTDGSLCLVSLPTLAIIHIERARWLPDRAGAITCAYVDEIGDRPFAYFGTSTGTLYVVQLENGGGIRLCDYVLRYQDFGLSEEMALTSMQLSTKDERFLALGFSHTEMEHGTIGIFDLIKRKVLKAHSTAGAITSLCWNQVGDVVFAGTSSGELLAFTERNGATCMFHTASEAGGDVHGDDDEDGDEASSKIPIKQLRYMHTQPSTGEPCLFVLLGSSAFEDEYVKNVIVGLTPPAGGVGTMKTVFSLPPLHGEDVCSFDLVATVDDPLSPSSTALPGLLLVTKHSDLDASDEHSLRVIRCPSSTMASWPLEIGMLPDPSIAADFDLGPSAVTAMACFPPSASPASVAGILVQGLDGLDQSMTANGQCLTAKEFFQRIDESTGGAHAKGSDEGGVPWRLCLATGNTEEVDVVKQRAQNVLLLGHADGTVVAWAATRSVDVSGGHGTSMVPIAHFRTLDDQITAIGVDEGSGIFAVGSHSGGVVLYETYDTDNLVGYIQHQQHLIKSIRLPAASVTNDTSEDAEVDDSETVGEEDAELAFSPNTVRVVKSVELQSKVTSVLVIGEICTIILGTEDGSLFWWSIIAPSTAGKGHGEPTRVNTSSLGFPTLRHVSGMHYSSFVKTDEAVPAVYAIYASGHVVAFSPLNGEVLGFTAGSGLTDVMEETDFASSGPLRSTATAALVCTLDASSKPSSSLNSRSLLRHARCELELVMQAQAAEKSPSKSVFSILGSKTVDSPIRSFQRPRVNPVNQGEYPDGSAITLMVAIGRSLCTYDITKFSTPALGAAKGTKSGSISSALVSSQFLTKSRLVAGQVISFFNEATRAWAEPFPCLVCITVDGGLLVMRIADRTLICSERLLSGIVGSPANLSLGAILASRECFVSRKGTTLFMASFDLEGHIASPPISPPIEPVFNALSRNGPKLLMPSSRTQAAAPKRQSILTMASGATSTDLTKVFAKTLDQRQKDDLITGARGSRDTDEEQPSTQRQLDGVAAIANTMAETRDALMERGERINRLTLKADDLQQGAQEFNQNAKTMVKELKKKKKWGFF